MTRARDSASSATVRATIANRDSRGAHFANPYKNSNHAPAHNRFCAHPSPSPSASTLLCTPRRSPVAHASVYFIHMQFYRTGCLTLCRFSIGFMFSKLRPRFARTFSSCRLSFPSFSCRAEPDLKSLHSRCVQCSRSMVTAPRARTCALRMVRLESFRSILLGQILLSLFRAKTANFLVSSSHRFGAYLLLATRSQCWPLPPWPTLSSRRSARSASTRCSLTILAR